MPPHSLGGGELAFPEAETQPQWTIFQHSLLRTPFTEQLASGGVGGDTISCFHFQFFRKTGPLLVFGKCFQSNNQLWSRRSSPHIFNEPKLMRCHNDDDFFKKTFKWLLLSHSFWVGKSLWTWLAAGDAPWWLDHTQWLLGGHCLQLCSRKWAVFPHFKNQNGIIMTAPYICKELLAKYFALCKHCICHIYF